MKISTCISILGSLQVSVLATSDIIHTGVTTKADGMYVNHAVALVALIDLLFVGSFWRACIWTRLLKQ
ncbi:hypothetical protein EDD18DRAFT_697185 [Armillaria luteobubalina]|uniref:Uncharacterized protein n=1 Tax=Armillaria luteobubalina TaxID=153913 RepID=A0AA39QGP9_9AGAR|nr:hypothetical protein EDD18DRAFT_697185 [Armillaria luteobubalina]